MTVAATSRYAASRTATAVRGGKTVAVLLPQAPAAMTFSYVSHMISDTDRLDLLADQYLGSPAQWWQIARANPDLGIDWTSVPAGTVVRIPYGQAAG